jgi:outer membrane biosynthesis protein TonB
MNRLQKKCFIASVLAHASLVLVLLVGPAFLPHNPPLSDDLPLLEFIPLKTTDDLISGGGNPNANSAPRPLEPPPVQPQPQPPVQPASPPERKPEPAPPKPEPRPAQPVPDEPSLEPANKQKKEFNLKPIVRKSPSTSSKPSAAEQRAKQVAEARKKAAKQIGQTMAALGNGLSSGTSVELKGPGGGGCARQFPPVSENHLRQRLESTRRGNG